MLKIECRTFSNERTFGKIEIDNTLRLYFTNLLTSLPPSTIGTGECYTFIFRQMSVYATWICTFCLPEFFPFVHHSLFIWYDFSNRLRSLSLYCMLFICDRNDFASSFCLKTKCQMEMEKSVLSYKRQKKKNTHTQIVSRILNHLERIISCSETT